MRNLLLQTTSSWGLKEDNLPLYDFAYTNTFQNQIAFRSIATGSVRNKNINFESDRANTNKTQTILSIFKSFKQPSDD